MKEIYCIIIFIFLVSCREKKLNHIVKYHDNGSIRLSYFQDEKKLIDSTAIEYYPNGVVKYTSWNIDNKPYGNAKLFYENGSLMKDFFFIGGKMNYYNYYYSDSSYSSREVGFYINDTLYYSSNEYFSDGVWKKKDEEYYPKIYLNKDSTFVGDTVGLTFYLPISDLNINNLYIRYGTALDTLVNNKYQIDTMYEHEVLSGDTFFKFVALKPSVIVCVGDIYVLERGEIKNIGDILKKIMIYPK